MYNPDIGTQIQNGLYNEGYAECWAKAGLTPGPAQGWLRGQPGRAIKRGYQDVYAGESHPHFMAGSPERIEAWRTSPPKKLGQTNCHYVFQLKDRLRTPHRLVPPNILTFRRPWVLTLWPPMRILEVMQTLFHCQAGESTTLNHLQKASKRRNHLHNGSKCYLNSQFILTSDVQLSCLLGMGGC